jgi:hypothetical protein
MTIAPGYPLLEGPWIWPAPQHFQIVVGFDDQEVEVDETTPGQATTSSKVGRQAKPIAPFVLDDETHRLSRIVRNRKWLHLKLT